MQQIIYNNDEDHTAFPSQTPKTRKTIGSFLKTVGTKLEWTFRPYVQRSSSAIQIRKNILQKDKINKTKMNSFSKQSQHP